MTFSMYIVATLLVVALALFIWERLPVELVALSVFCVLLITGVLTPVEAFAVFSNEAPLTVAAMFVLSDLLLKTGGTAGLSNLLAAAATRSQTLALGVMMLLAAFASAFVNNTPVVAIFIPVVVHMAREAGVSSSRFLIPLSYAALLGGCCTLVGTSTNLVVHGVAKSQGLPGFGMFEVSLIGVPLLIICGGIVLLLAPHLMPNRQTVASMLSPEQRRSRIFQLLVERDSPLDGQRLLDCAFMHVRGVTLLEVRRRAERITSGWEDVVLRPFDRLTIVPSKVVAGNEPSEEPRLFLGNENVDDLRLELLSTIPGGVAEGVVGPRSHFAGRTLRSLRLRSEFAVHTIAVHRKGVNLQDQFLDIPLHVGDTLLVLGSDASLQRLNDSGHLLLADEPVEAGGGAPHPPDAAKRHQALVWMALGAVIITSSIGLIPISTGALTACILLALLGVSKTDAAIRSIDWSVMLTIYGMLGLGVAVQKSGLDGMVARTLVEGCRAWASPELLPWILLGAFGFVTILLTELISNNAAAAVNAPLAIGLANYLGVSPTPFLMAVMMGASLAFAVPMGYQTHLMVYGVGGDRFTDFLRIGLLLDFVVWIAITLLVPLIWPFTP